MAPQGPQTPWNFDEFEKVRRGAALLDGLKDAVGGVNPRPPGLHNRLIQGVKRFLARLLNWYTKPWYEFNSSVSRSLQEAVWAVDHLTASLAALDQVSRQQVFEHLSVDTMDIERQMAALAIPGEPGAEPLRGPLEALHERVKVLVDLEKTAKLELKNGDVVNSERRPLGRHSVTWHGAEFKDKTIYIIGLFGTGRKYINELVLHNTGERAKYFRDTIRLHPGPTPMIYSGHVTIKHVSRSQEAPPIMRCILDNVRAGYADVIFIYRHPLDSLLTNWIWWRTFLREQIMVTGVSEVYKTTDELCAGLEENFAEFERFAAGDPAFFASRPGPRFLSFAEFVEETELHLQAATLPLRLEDFMTDPNQEFSKILKVIPVEGDSSRFSVPPPRSKPYGHLAVQEKLPRFRDFVAGLDSQTLARLERVGYRLH